MRLRTAYNARGGLPLISAKERRHYSKHLRLQVLTFQTMSNSTFRMRLYVRWTCDRQASEVHAQLHIRAERKKEELKTTEEVYANSPFQRSGVRRIISNPRDGPGSVDS